MKDKRSMSRPVGEAETWSHQNPTRVQGPTNRRDISQIWNFFMRSKGFVLHVRHPRPWDLHGKAEPPKHLDLKTNGAYVLENQRTLGNGESSLKGLACRLICPRTLCKSSSLKEPRPYVKGFICYLKASVTGHATELLKSQQKKSKEK